MRIVPVNSIKGEALLAQDLYAENGTILLKKGVSLTPILLERIQDNNIFSIYIIDGYSNVEIEDVIRPELRRKAATMVMETFKKIEKDAVNVKFSSTNIKTVLDAKMTERYISSLRGVANEIISDMTSNNNLLINLVDIKNIDTFTYDHSVNVAIMSVVLAIESKLPKSDLQHLFMSALLHDIGKMFIPKELLVKKEPYTPEEEDIIRNHPKMGYDYIRSNFNFQINVTNGILQHHERHNGLGYPRGLTGAQISTYAKIIGIVDTYDLLTSDTNHHKAHPPCDALEMIMGSSGSLFDYDFVNVFSRKIVPFPVGTLIKLSGDMVGVVEAQNENYPLKPKVKIVNRKSPRFDSQIDLMKDKTVVILGHQYEDPNL